MQSALLICVLLTSFATSLTTRLVHQFPPGTWLENLAIRPGGSVLVTTLAPDAAVYEIDPSAPRSQSTKLVSKFASSTGAFGITASPEGSDTFYVITSNSTVNDFTETPGTNKIQRITFPGPKVEFVSLVKDANVLNGLTALNEHTILAADSIQGAVYAINTVTGAYRKVITDPLMSRPTAQGLGINGLRVQGNELYFTNSARFLLAKLPLKPDGTAAGKAVKISSSKTVPIARQEQYDDFATDQNHAYATTMGGNVIQEVDICTGQTRLIAGNLNSTSIAEPTSAQVFRTYGRPATLFITTGGAYVIPVYQNGQKYQNIGGQLVAVQLDGE
ncbi:hypothetical protein FH972_021156 [Carpinus fangiana]|uniref:SMP-30/Gluconolactonase/LRE-like region domain-containing protein n=1 Tax=Carpinus fangiana TaxID=176857 RepID=A0A5N6KNI5_9ROSI|nr:hypothetical protein FH972_021156 [Carpinus fangiana]